MNNGLIVEIHIARLKAGVSETDFLKAAEAIMPDVIAMDGFVSRQLLKSADGQWVEMITWRSMADAGRAAKAFEKLPSGQTMIDMVDLTSLTMLFAEPMLVYDPQAVAHS
jgi:heme-degrading monooxygenase HmoA